MIAFDGTAAALITFHSRRRFHLPKEVFPEIPGVRYVENEVSIVNDLGYIIEQCNDWRDHCGEFDDGKNDKRKIRIHYLLGGENPDTDVRQVHNRTYRDLEVTL